MKFETEEMLSKWGFDDGDMLYEFKLKHRLKLNSATLLVEVVRLFVLPQLRQRHRLEATIVPGVHNPIRLTMVDGVAVDNENPPDLKLTPPTVDVSDEAIISIANNPQLIAEQEEEERISNDLAESMILMMAQGEGLPSSVAPVAALRVKDHD